MENQSRIRRIILIVLGIIVVCSLLCVIPFVLFGSAGLISGSQIVMGTAIRNQPVAPPAEVIAPDPVENLPTEIPSPTPTLTNTPTITPTPTRPTLTPTPALPAAGACVPGNSQEKAIVVEVVDGETVKVVMHEKTYTVRYIGIQAPVFGLQSEPFGPEAANLNNTLVKNQVVTMVMDTSDKNEAGDLLRYVFAGESFINLEMVRQGLAQAVSVPLDTSCDAYLLQAQQSAQQDHLGQWKDFVVPETPSVTPTINLTASPTPQPVAGPCNCQGPDLDCADFATRADAQTCYNYCKKLGFGDIFLIDIDHDGIACINKRP
jgi:endonuclease YncB( thermonuclease family)